MPPAECSHPCPKVEAPVPPSATAMSVPFQTPVAMVPSVVRFVEPAQVESAVFSTRFKARVVLRFAVEVPARVVAPEA